MTAPDRSHTDPSTTDQPSTDPSTTGTDRPADPTACVSSLSPAAKLVYRTLERQGTLTQTELKRETGLCRNSIRSVTRDLADCGVLEIRPDPTDARRRLYVPTGNT